MDFFYAIFQFSTYYIYYNPLEKGKKKLKKVVQD